MANKFKNVNGVLLKRELFFETALNRDNVLYTLKTEDYKGYPSLYRLYMEADDPTEYSFAISCFDSWDHWQAIANSSFMKDYVSAWRKELEIRIRSQELLRLRQIASKNGREAPQIIKYLLEGGWTGKRANVRGRPSKAEIEHNANLLLQQKNSVDEDFERIMN